MNCKNCGVEFTPQGKEKFCAPCLTERARREALRAEAWAAVGCSLNSFGLVVVPSGHHPLCGDPETDGECFPGCFRTLQGAREIWADDFSSITSVEGQFCDLDGHGPIRRVVGVEPDVTTPAIKRPHWTDGLTRDEQDAELQADEAGE